MTPAANLRRLPGDWLIPDWPAPARVRAVFTTRSGGCSSAPYDSFNLGDHVGDDPAQVQANRLALQASMGGRPVFMKQEHGVEVLTLHPSTPDGLPADACVTASPGLACTVMVADCLPVLLAHPDFVGVAAAHAGWRGLAGTPGQNGVLEELFKSFSALALVNRENVATKTIAWLGPCIGPQVFEVGAEVKAAFEISTSGASDLFVATPNNTYLANLQGLARLRLNALGIRHIYGNDGSPGWCTVANVSRFFSHRRSTRAASGLGADAVVNRA